MSKKTFIWAVIALICVRILLLALFLNNIPSTDIQSNWRPVFHGTYQPDEIVFFNLAKSLADFKPAPSIVYIGHAIFLAPFIYFTGATNIEMAIKPLILVQGILVWSLALILLVIIGLYFFKNKKLALFGGFIFLIYPYLLYGLYKLINPKTAIAAFHYQMWIFMLSDYLSLFFILLTMWLSIKFIKRLKTENGNLYRSAIILGAIAGITALVRPPNLVIPAFLFFFVLYSKKIKTAFLLGISSFFTYLPQLIYNTHFFGRPWLFGNPILNAGATAGATESFVQKNWAFSNYWLNFSYFSPNHYLLFFFAAFSFMFIILFAGLRYLRKTNPHLIPLFAFWFLFYWLFYASFGGSLSQLRYFLPLIPALIYFALAGALYFFDCKKDNVHE
ncbi:hypothetical protein HY838_00070 [Candidatus Azambacteria bacterium]|nr:hypothetical protein [Candidatus Azambacteria bacterium]